MLFTARVSSQSPVLVSVRVAILGNVDSGKSTLVGVLSKNILDDGRGKARAFVFQHRHEHETGRTSTSSLELLVRWLISCCG